MVKRKKFEIMRWCPYCKKETLTASYKDQYGYYYTCSVCHNRTSNPVHPQATESLKRYKDDLKAGHKDAAEYWRGQASAYFTANPSDYRIKKMKGSHGFSEYQILKGSGPFPEYVASFGTKEEALKKLRELRKKEAAENPILESIGAGLGLGTGFAIASKAVGKVWKNPISEEAKMLKGLVTESDMRALRPALGKERVGKVLSDICRRRGLRNTLLVHSALIELTHYKLPVRTA